MRLAIGVVARGVFWLCLTVIVGDAVATLFARGDGAEGVAALIFFPLTTFLWPWTHAAFGVSLIAFFVIAAVAYPISTFVGGLSPVE